MWNKTKSLQLSLLLVKVLFVFIPILMTCVPVIAEWYDAVYGEGVGFLDGSVYWPLSITLYLAAICAMVCLYALHKLLGNIKKDEVFTPANCKCLRIISWCCILAAIPFGLLGIWRFLSFIVALAAAFFGLILRVLKNVFEKAVELKEENDFTI